MRLEPQTIVKLSGAGGMPQQVGNTALLLCASKRLADQNPNICNFNPLFNLRVYFNELLIVTL